MSNLVCSFPIALQGRQAKALRRGELSPRGHSSSPPVPQQGWAKAPGSQGCAWAKCRSRLGWRRQPCAWFWPWQAGQKPAHTQKSTHPTVDQVDALWCGKHCGSASTLPPGNPCCLGQALPCANVNATRRLCVLHHGAARAGRARDASHPASRERRAPASLRAGEQLCCAAPPSRLWQRRIGPCHNACEARENSNSQCTQAVRQEARDPHNPVPYLSFLFIVLQEDPWKPAQQGSSVSVSHTCERNARK